MANITKIFNTNFLEYASYVIKDRAIPHMNDGLKPVQRRILHSMFEMDDGKFNKVANIVGHCMKYHPHGDASIYSALVVIANKDMFIEKQGNFGNIYTGDEAAAARYIECRLLPLAKEVLYNPDITEYIDSYDGRNREPVTFPAKIPVVLAFGAEGIAVGMATKILPHNLIELLEAQVAVLKEQPFQIFPDFPTGGIMDASEYNDGNGRIMVRAKIDAPDNKRIIIRELPFGTTTESIIASIENAAKKNKITIASISDFTSENVEIEIKLARGVRASDTMDALYAFTDCETSVSCNFTIINPENKPQVLSATKMVEHSTSRLLTILTDELNLEQNKLKDALHAKTLEQIFIENRIYKAIEKMTTHDAVIKSVVDGLAPFQSKINREITQEDIERLLKIPIRRISLYDINKAKKEIQEINKRIKEIRHHLAHIVDYAVAFLEKLIEKYRAAYPRRTRIESFQKVDVREAAARDLKLCYNKDTGYIGYEIEGNEIAKVSQYDRVLIIRKSGEYNVIDVPDKLFIDKGMLYCGLVNKETVFNIVYREPKTDIACVKRCKIESFILNKNYSLLPERSTVLRFTTNCSRYIKLEYKPSPRLRILEETFRFVDFPVRGNKAKGIRMSRRPVRAAKFIMDNNGNNDKPTASGGGTPQTKKSADKPKPNGEEGQMSFEF